MGTNSRMGVEGPQATNVDINDNNKIDVTLIDAFRIKELNLLIFSYLFR